MSDEIDKQVERTPEKPRPVATVDEPLGPYTEGEATITIAIFKTKPPRVRFSDPDGILRGTQQRLASQFIRKAYMRRKTMQTQRAMREGRDARQSDIRQQQRVELTVGRTPEPVEQEKETSNVG